MIKEDKLNVFKRLWLLTFYDAREKDIFSIQHFALCKVDAEIWFHKYYIGNDLLLSEDITNYPTFEDFNFED